MISKIIFLDIKNSIGDPKTQYEEGIGTYKLSRLAKEAGIETIVFQDHLFFASPERLAELVGREYVPGAVLAISLLSDGIDLMLQTIKLLAPLNIPVMIGGAGATIDPRYVTESVSRLLAEHTPLAVVEGDGEGAFSDLMRIAPEKWQGLDSIWCVDSRGRIKEGTFQICDLEKSPLPYLEASHARRYFAEIGQTESCPIEERYRSLRALTSCQLEIGKGCYYRCGFCNTSCLSHQQVRKKTPQGAVNEILSLYREFGVTFFSFTDNVAFDRADYWEEFADLIGDLPESPYIFFGGYSAPHFLRKPEWLDGLLPKLYSVGLRSVIIGVQAGSKRILQEIIKRSPQDPGDAIVITRAAVKIGINVKIDFIIGHPTETPADLEETYRCMAKLIEEGGEVFVRELKVIPHSRYALMLKNGYQLPEENEDWEILARKIFSLRRDDSIYRKLALVHEVPNKYIIDRKIGIVYPHEVFDIGTLRESKEKLRDSLMHQKAKDIFEKMFLLLLEMKREKRA